MRFRWRQVISRFWRWFGSKFSFRLRSAAFRRLLRIPERVDPELEIKIAETIEEVIQALTLLHQAYVDLGYDTPHESGVRITPYHLLPTTTIVVAKKKGKVVGTLSIIKDSPLGLPTDKLVDLARFRRRGERIAEGSSIAVDPSFRDRHATMLLIKYIWQYLRNHCGVRHLVITINPRHELFYRAVMLFKPITGRRTTQYDFVQADAAIPLVIDLKAHPEQLRRVYGKADKNRNMHHLLVHARRPEIRLPDARLYQANHSCVSLDMLKALHRRGLLPSTLFTTRFSLLIRRTYGLDDKTVQSGSRPGQKPGRPASRFLQDPRWGELWAVNAAGNMRVTDENGLHSVACHIFSVRSDGVDLAFKPNREVPGRALLVLPAADRPTLRVELALEGELIGRRFHYRVTETNAAWTAFAEAIVRRNLHGETGLLAPLDNDDGDSRLWRAPDSLISIFAHD